MRTRLINIPARVAFTSRRLDLHLPTHWSWQAAGTNLWTTATGPPATAPA